MPKVTFVMPTIHDEYLQQAINSMQAQTIQDFECLVYNNDVNRDLEIDDNRFKVLDTNNWNIAKCLNHAHRTAKSDVILHHGDDDESFPERAEISLKYINEGYNMACCGFIAMNTDEKVVYCYLPREFNWHLVRFYTNTIPLLSSAYKLSEAPNYREDYPALHDYCFVYDFYKNGMKYKNVSMPVLIRRVHGDSFTLSSCEARAEETKKLQILYGDDKIRSKRDDERLVKQIKKGVKSY